MRIPRLALLIGALLPAAALAQSDDAGSPNTGSVIFIHPDGTSAASWTAARALFHGPDGDLHWDRMPHVAVYRGHMADSLTATSNGGATTHAFGVKVDSGAYGRTAAGERGEDITDSNGRSLSVAHQALRHDIPVGVVQSGTVTEPGTGCFLAPVEKRAYHDKIAVKLIESGAQVILGGGEQFFLPEGAQGVHGPGARQDGRNLIEEAKQHGYTVVRTRQALLELQPDTEKVLGLFASNHTFNDKPEETLAEQGLPLYQPDTPSLAEMTDVALKTLSNQGEQFLLIAEEEGLDNFGNKNNAKGMLEAMRRSDETYGVARRFIQEHRDTLVFTCADSDAGGMHMVGMPIQSKEDIPSKLPPRSKNGAPIDGRDGTGTAPFLAAPDRTGQVLPFAVVWATGDDASGGVVVRAEGLNSHLVRGSFDNTDVARLIRLTLFGHTNP